MSYFKRNCAVCGTPYSAWSNYCSHCGEPLEPSPPPEEEMLDGVAVSDWHLFIDKNASRYIEVFEKHKDKAVFLHMNWSAMFFHVYWLFYRRMYKYALIFGAVILLFSVLATTGLLASLKPELEAAEDIIAPYSHYLEEDIGTLYFEDIDTLNAIQQATTEYRKAVNVVNRKLLFRVLFYSLLLQAVFGLLADCLYRSYIRKHIQHTNGGTSGWSLVGGMALYLGFNRLIGAPIVAWVAEKLLG